MSRPPVVALIIFDGWGLRAERQANAILAARTPTVQWLCNTQAHTELDASGEAVGLAPQVMGNSEVGHLTIGAGRVIYQDVMRINNAPFMPGDFSLTAAFTVTSTICLPCWSWPSGLESRISPCTRCSTAATNHRAPPDRLLISWKPGCGSLGGVALRQFPAATTRWIAISAGKGPSAPGAQLSRAKASRPQPQKPQLSSDTRQIRTMSLSSPLWSVRPIRFRMETRSCALTFAPIVPGN